MTQDVERFAFLIRQRPVCTQSPLVALLGSERHRELLAKYKLELGIDLLADRCPNSFNCISAQAGCIGRPFPLDVEIAQALSKLNIAVKKGVFKGREVYLGVAIVDCSTCPFVVGCASACATQEAYLKKATRPDLSPKGPQLVSIEKYEQGAYGVVLDLTIENHIEEPDRSWVDETLPLDCLSDKQREVVELSIYEGLDQIVIADKLGLKQHTVSNCLSSALLRLSEFGRVRKVIQGLPSVPMEVTEYYLNNLSQEDIASKYNRKQGNVSNTISTWIGRNCH